MSETVSKALVEAAKHAAQNAYCPYSGYHVGSALLDDRGRVSVGCNVENIAYGSTLCAERGAVMQMVADGGKRIAEMVVFTLDGGTPCGACLQVIREFAETSLPIWLISADGSAVLRQLSELLPHAFQSSEVKRTEQG